MAMIFTVVPHVHWDREWYFTEQKSRVCLNRYLSDVLDALDDDPRIIQYLFDAQTSLVDDYLEDHPERAGQLRRLVSERRLLTGPWYTQCDQLVIHGESIVRNLMYGTRESSDLGHCFRVGYAPDCFGQAAQAPQIYSGFGINSVMFKRGIDTKAVPADDFIWESEDGSRVFAYHLSDYMNFRNPSRDARENIELVERLERRYEGRSLSGHAFLFNGFDQHPLRRDIADIVTAMGPEAHISFGDLEDEVSRMSKTPDLPVYKGELTSGETTRVHKSIFSSRADIKSLNSKVENLLIRIAEPLQAIYHRITGHHEREMFRRCWKALMKNSAHDSIGCCNSDEVNRDIETRFLQTISTLSAYETLIYRQVARGSACEPFSLQVYNYLPYARTEELHMTLLAPFPRFSLVDTKGRVWPTKELATKEVTDSVCAGYAFAVGANNTYNNPYEGTRVWRCDIRATVRVDAIGYETFSLCETDSPAEAPSPSPHLENEYLKVSPNDDGTIEIADKRTGHVYHRVLEIVDDVDAGDSYDWSSDPEARLVVSSVEQPGAVTIEEQSIRILIEMPIPANRDERAHGNRSSTERIEIEVSLPAGKPVLRTRVIVDNAATEHRLRILIPTDLPSSTSHADQTFGILDRPTKLTAEEQRWISDRWSERPRTIEPMQSLCYLSDDERVVSVMTDSVKEYQIVGEGRDTIAYTILRSFTKMGRSNLPDRPGRESGKTWDTPNAALLGRYESTFAIGFALTEAEAIRLASEYTTPLRVHQEARYETSGDEFVCGGGEAAVPTSTSLFSVDGNYQFSVFKLAEDPGMGDILRFTQLDEIPAHVTSCDDLLLTNLAEDRDQPYEETSPRTRNQIVTVRMKEHQ